MTRNTPPESERWRRPRIVAAIESLRVVCAIALALALVFVTLTYVGEWSWFVASPARPRVSPPASPGGPPSPAMQQRDETHFILGRGLICIYSLNVYTGSFSNPGADQNSLYLARETVGNYFGRGVLWRWMRTNAGPTIGVRSWPLPLLPALVWSITEVVRRRQVKRYECARCRYDLRGVPADAGVCPECGAGRT